MLRYDGYSGLLPYTLVVPPLTLVVIPLVDIPLNSIVYDLSRWAACAEDKHKFALVHSWMQRAALEIVRVP